MLGGCKVYGSLRKHLHCEHLCKSSHATLIHLVRTQTFPKNFYPLICTRTRAYQMVRNVSFFGKLYIRTKWMIPKWKICMHLKPSLGCWNLIKVSNREVKITWINIFLVTLWVVLASAYLLLFKLPDFFSQCIQVTKALPDGHATVFYSHDMKRCLRSPFQFR